MWGKKKKKLSWKALTSSSSKSLRFFNPHKGRDKSYNICLEFYKYTMCPSPFFFAMAKGCSQELSEALGLCQEQINSKPSLKKSAFSSLPIQETGYKITLGILALLMPSSVLRVIWKSSNGSVLDTEVSGNKM